LQKMGDNNVPTVAEISLKCGGRLGHLTRRTSSDKDEPQKGRTYRLRAIATAEEKGPKGPIKAAGSTTVQEGCLQDVIRRREEDVTGYGQGSRGKVASMA